MKRIAYLVGILLIVIASLVAGYYYRANSEGNAIVLSLYGPNAQGHCSIGYMISGMALPAGSFYPSIDVNCKSNCFLQARIGKPLPADCLAIIMR